MQFQKRVAAVDWRKSLSTDETVEVAQLDRRAAELDAERREVSRDLFMIRNRAWHRAKKAMQRAEGCERRGLPQ